jgi:chromosome segregation ATPase
VNYQDTKTELSAARRCQADLRSQQVEVERKLKSLGAYDSKQTAIRAHARDLEADISKLENRIKELEQVVSEAEAARRADIEARLPDVKAALLSLDAALDTCAKAESAVEAHRISLRDAKLPGFRQLPALVQPHAKRLVEQATRELDAAR